MAPRGLHPFRVKARELLRQPGSTTDVDVTLDASEIGVDDPRIAGDVVVDLTATSTVDSIAVHGQVAMPWTSQCRRCLTEVSGLTAIEISEIYQDPDDISVDHDDAFPIEGDQIDLVPAVREAMLLELPDDVLCRPDCAGICPVCGTDHNTGSCSCDTTVRDERWSVLDDLDLDE